MVRFAVLASLIAVATTAVVASGTIVSGAYIFELHLGEASGPGRFETAGG